MTTEDSYVRFVMECATLPPLTPGETLHWNGLSPASRGRDLMPAAMLEARFAMPAQGDPMAGPSVTPPLRSCLALPQVPTSCKFFADGTGQIMKPHDRVDFSHVRQADTREGSRWHA